MNRWKEVETALATVLGEKEAESLVKAIRESVEDDTIKFMNKAFG